MLSLNHGMLGTHPLSLKGADLALYYALYYHKEGLALVIADISGVGVFLSYAVVALCTRREQHAFCRKYT